MRSMSLIAAGERLPRKLSPAPGVGVPAAAWFRSVTATRAAERPWPLWAEGLAIAGLLYGLYSLLALGIFLGDGSFILAARAGGVGLHDSHVLSYAVTAAAEALARPFTADRFAALSVAMRLCMVLGVLVAHRTLASLGAAAAPRILGALLVGCTGAVLLYGTAIERQAPFFPFAALAVHALVHCGRAPSLARGALLGAATAVATLVHATGHLLFLLVVPWLVLCCERERGTVGAALRALLAALLVHAGVLCLAYGVLAAGGHDVLARQAGVVLGYSRWTWDGAVSRFAYEFLLPFLPGSVLVVWALLRRDTRRLGLAVLAAAVPYQAFTFVVERNMEERGAYNLPLALPLAIVLVRLLPARALALAVVVALASAVGLNRTHARTMPDPPSRQEIAAATADGRAVVMFVGPWSLRPVLRHLPGIATVDLLGFAQTPLPFAEICALFDRGHAAARAAGHPMLIARECLDLVDGPAPLPTGLQRLFAEHLRVRYRFTERQAAAFHYVTVEPLTDVEAMSAARPR